VRRCRWRTTWRTCSRWIDDHQRLLSHDLETDPEGEARQHGVDSFGNHCLWFSRVQLHDHLLVRSTSRVRAAAALRRAAPRGARRPGTLLAERLRYVARGPYDPAVSSPAVALRAAAGSVARLCAAVVPARAPGGRGALDLMHRLHADFEYRSASTQIDTPLAQAFAQRAGVCQDFAHLMAGAMRMLGLPVRYVSGYLLTRPPGEGGRPGGRRRLARLGAGLQPRHPGVPADWLDLDPTNDLCPAPGMCAWRSGATLAT
jgi:transglutaminase-like putative cysteine protease